MIFFNVTFNIIQTGENILNFSSKDPSQSIEELDSEDLSFAHSAEDSTERNAFW